MFKQLLLVGFVAALAICAAANGLAIEREISWTDDYEAAVQRASTTNSIILLHFYGDYCPPCKLLEKKTFHDPALVSKMNEHLVPVKINADRRRDLAQKYQVTRWPTDVYLFPNGDEIYRGVSNADPAVYCKTIERVALRHRDWTVERNSMARAKEKRQDRALAAHTPQIHSEPVTYAGNAGHSVRTQAASWTNAGDTVSGDAKPAPVPVPPTSGSRVIENPFVTREPIVPPAEPVKQHTRAPDRVADTAAAPIVSTPILSALMVASPVVAMPVSMEADKYPSQSSTKPPAVPASNSIQQIYAESIGLGGFCPVTLIE